MAEEPLGPVVHGVRPQVGAHRPHTVPLFLNRQRERRLDHPLHPGGIERVAEPDEDDLGDLEIDETDEDTDTNEETGDVK